MLFDRRTLLAAPLAFPFAGLARAAAPSLPLLPLNTGFTYWDHHWIQWLDGHPVYETIEVALGATLPSGDPLVRLWLTERAGGKRQVHYFNDAEAARGFPYEAHVVPIRIALSGTAGAPRGISLSFTDKDGGPVRWDVRFAGAEALTEAGGGLKPQNGHAARSVMLFWYIGSGAITRDAVAFVGGTEFRPAADAASRRTSAGYSAGGYIAALIYAPSEIAATPEGFRSSWNNRSFVRDGARYVARFEAFRQQSSIELRCAADNALLGYRHTHGSHVLAIDFDAALSVPGRVVGFDMAIDRNHVAEGSVTPAADGSRLNWDFASPEWAHEVGLATAISPRPNGYAMRVTPLR